MLGCAQCNAGCTGGVCRVYMLGLTLEWIKSQGGVDAMDKCNKMKCAMIYDVIDNSDGFY